MPSSSSGLYQLDATGLTRRRAQRLNRSYTTPRGTTARRGPPEDVGSVPGYYDFLEAVSNPRHREHRRLVEWYGGPYDPDDINLTELRFRLAQIAKRRHAGKAAYDKQNRKS